MGLEEFIKMLEAMKASYSVERGKTTFVYVFGFTGTVYFTFDSLGAPLKVY